MKSQRASHQQRPEPPAALLSLRNPEDLHWEMQQAQLAIARGVAVCGRISCWALRSGSCVIHVQGTCAYASALRSLLILGHHFK
jgi:hypothetical protein